MKFGNLPEIVKYTEFGRTSFALPIGSRSPDHHTGANDEPLLHLVIVGPVLDPLDPAHKATLNIVGTTRENELVKIIHDVAHESHEFTDAQLTAIGKTGITVSQVYPGNKIVGGRWTELSSAELHNLLLQAEDTEKAASVKAAQAEAKIVEDIRLQNEATEKAKADAPAPIDDITREALIRNKQDELRAASAQVPAAVEPVKEPEKSKLTLTSDNQTLPGSGTGGEGSGGGTVQ